MLTLSRKFQGLLSGLIQVSW